jgi:hypothetical protein
MRVHGVKQNQSLEITDHSLQVGILSPDCDSVQVRMPRRRGTFSVYAEVETEGGSLIHFFFYILLISFGIPYQSSEHEETALLVNNWTHAQAHWFVQLVHTCSRYICIYVYKLRTVHPPRTHLH